MPIPISCPGCKATYNVGDDLSASAFGASAASMSSWSRLAPKRGCQQS